MFHKMQISKYMALGALVVLALGCSKKVDEGSAQSGAKVTIQNAGSDTMVNLAQAWSEEYAKVEPLVSVEVSGGGSGTGIAGLIDGTVELANCSRQIADEEKARAIEKLLKDKEDELGRKLEPDERAKAKQDTIYKPWKLVVGHDGLAVYVHKDNPLEEITLEQLAEIYGEGGTITKWSQLGIKHPLCSNDEIIRISRQSNSGTYEYFREALAKVKGKDLDFKLGSRDLHGSKDVVELVGKTPCAIGYSGMGYATPEVKMLRVARKVGEPFHAPNVENTLAQTYPISRPLYLYTLGPPKEHTKKYLDWIHSEAGQKIVEVTGYVPLPKTAGMVAESSGKESQ